MEMKVEGIVGSSVSSVTSAAADSLVTLKKKRKKANVILSLQASYRMTYDSFINLLTARFILYQHAFRAYVDMKENEARADQRLINY